MKFAEFFLGVFTAFLNIVLLIITITFILLSDNTISVNFLMTIVFFYYVYFIFLIHILIL